MLAGCVNSPRAQSELTHKDAPVRFEGLAPNGDAPVRIEAYDFAAQRWEEVAKLPISSSDDVSYEALGMAYRFSGNLRLPSEARYWSKGHGGKPELRAKLRALQGTEALRTFDLRADGCVENARQAGRGAIEALETCKSSESPVVELRVPHCGSEGESCCRDHEQKGAACGASFRCNADRCERPDYPLPLVPGYQEDVAIASGHSIRDAWLELDDNSSGADSTLPLVTSFEPVAGVELLAPHPNVARLRFDLPLWQPGFNRVRVRGTTSRGGASASFATAYRKVALELSPRFGLPSPGVVALPAEHYPRTPAQAYEGRCKDADADGLCDLWENVVIHQLRPLLRLDRKDALFGKANRGDTIRVLSSVTPWQRAGEEHVILFNVIAFSRDYGVMGFEHAGDTEGHALVLRLSADGSLHWTGSVAKGHACLTCKPSWQWGAQEFGVNGEPQLFVEKDKHGLWLGEKTCRKRSPFACGASRSVRPPITNVGDWSKTGARALVDELDHLSPFGPHAELSGVFPGEAVWSAPKARVKGRFCGGKREACSKKQSANLPGTVIKQLVQVVQRKGFQPVL